jgi:thiamine pyrophosphokinase
MTSRLNRIFLFANGELPAPENLLSLIKEDDYLIAVDGGLNHLVALGLSPDLIIGDLDSADAGQIEAFRAQGIEIRTYPTAKNETDLHLAIDIALGFGPEEVRVVAALGGRLDQTLANIFILTRADLAEVDIRLIDGNAEVLLIRKSAKITGAIGQRVSLVPLNGPVTGIRTEGLRFPLNNETLLLENTRGISNEMIVPTAYIEIHRGLLLCYHETR